MAKGIFIFSFDGEIYWNIVSSSLQVNELINKLLHNIVVPVVWCIVVVIKIKEKDSL
jgi:hypothetical protein